MTRHAFLITAYNDFDILEKCVAVYSSFGDVYIHVDKKSHMPESVKDRMLTFPNVKIIIRYKIYWGSYKHISAVIDLIKEAHKTYNYDFYHVLAGNTAICSDRDSFYNFFEDKRDKNFIEIIPVDERIAARYEYRYFLHRYNGKSEKGRRITDKLLALQKRLNMRCRRKFDYRGYFYCHLNGKFIDYLLNYLNDNRSYFKSLKTCLIPEEFFFQNVIMKSEYITSVVNDSLIFDCWTGFSGSPRELTEADFDEIANSGKLFCRKIGRSSLMLVDRLIEYYGQV